MMFNVVIRCVCACMAVKRNEFCVESVLVMRSRVCVCVETTN